MRLGAKLPRGVYCKLARPNGWDFYSGDTINYRDNIGGKVYAPEPHGKTLCAPGILHACKNPNDCFVGAKIPCAAFLVRGRSVANDGTKRGFHFLSVLEEVADLNALFGWNYTEACNPIHPFRLAPPVITDQHKALLHIWDSVWDSVGASVWASVGDSVRASVWASVWASVRAYTGSLFSAIPKWKYIGHPPGVYPFQAADDLWRMGLVPSFDGKTWRLHGGLDAKILYIHGPKES